jgi:cytochrome c553
LILAVAILAVSFAVSSFAADAAAGKAVFDGAKPACKGCHTDVKNPLAKAGAENSADELKAWVRTPKDMITKKAKKGIMPAYGPDKIADADLENLVAYMAAMK